MSKDTSKQIHNNNFQNKYDYDYNNNVFYNSLYNHKMPQSREEKKEKEKTLKNKPPIFDLKRGKFIKSNGKYKGNDTELKNQIEERNKQINQNKKDLFLLENKLKESNSQNENYKNTILKKNEEIQNLNKNIEDKNNEISSLNNKIIQKEELITQLGNKNKENESQILNLKNEFAENNDLLSQLQNNKKIVEIENLNYVQKIKDKDKQIEQQQKEIELLKKKIEENNIKMIEFEKRNKEMMNNINQLNINNSELKKIKNENNDKIIILESKILNKNKEIKSLNDILNISKNDISQMKKNEENNSKEICNLKNDIQKFRENNSKLRIQIQTNNNNILELKESINQKVKEINKYKKEIDELKNLLVSNDKEISQLKKEPNKLKEINESLNKSLIEIKNKIIDRDEKNNKLEEKIKKLENEHKDRINEINDLSIQNKKLENEKKNIEKAKNDLCNKLINFEKYEKDINKLKEENEKKTKELEIISQNADKSLKYENLKKEDFYDIIIKCDSISGLKKGWEISMNEKGKKNYYDLKDTKFTKIGIVGSENRGKSTVLMDLSQIELPTGVSIKTEGLSIKYPDLEIFKNRKIILLDSAGLETPILNSSNEEVENNSLIKDENNQNKKEEEKDNKEFANKSRDIIQLELFLQNFIIKYSNILILLLGKLTINEQKLLIKVKTHIKNLNRKEPLVVIHNLKEFETKKQVDDYINNVLKKSFTFNLIEGEEINLEKETSNWVYFYEPKSDPKIYHLIYAKKGAEAGNYYNQKNIEFIYHLIKAISDKESFDPVECVKNYFIEISETILEHPVKKGEIIDNRVLSQENNNANEITKILLKEPKEIILKKCLIDELGISNFRGNGFDAQYSYYITENNLYVYVELPGKKENPDEDMEYENVEIEPRTEGSYTFITIKGNKKHETKDFIKENINHFVHKRQFGEFNIEVKLDKINLDHEGFDCKIQNGCLIIDFKIKKNFNKRKI